ncbi:MAG: sigma-70 family RNA polymerase sigma factor [Proteobacteria bacterium]|nr:sigma-70 family RNA polymerase sigma factor [Pseudomonadota bacterium]
MARQTLKQEAKSEITKTSKQGLVKKIKVVKSVNPVVSIKSLDDLELITKFTNGCELSYMELITRYETKVHNLAMRLTKNPEDAEEVLQDVFLTVYRKIESFEGKAKFSSWLYRITVNAAFMKLRKRKQDQSISLDDMTPHAQNKALYEKNTYAIYSDSMAINNEVREMLEGAIHKLPDEYRAVFILRDIDGLSNKEVSEILTLSIPAVKSRLHRSRLMLRKKLRKFYNDYVNDTKILSPGAQYKQAA